jgi:hypothetical protein
MHRLDLADGHFVIAPNLDLRAQFAQVLDEVVSKRIVIVEDEDHGLIVAARGRFQGFKVSMIKAKARRSLDSLAATCHAYSRFRQVFETLKP